MVIFFMVRAHADRAENASRVAEVRIVILQTTVGAERHANLHGRLSAKANCQVNIDQVVDKHLHPRPGLRVPDVKVDGAGICTLGIANDPWWGYQANAVLVDSGAEDDFSILGSDGLATSKEGHVHEFTE